MPKVIKKKCGNNPENVAPPPKTEPPTLEAEPKINRHLDKTEEDDKRLMLEKNLQLSKQENKEMATKVQELVVEISKKDNEIRKLQEQIAILLGRNEKQKKWKSQF